MGNYECLVFVRHKVMSKLKTIMAKQMNMRFKINSMYCNGLKMKHVAVQMVS